MFIDYESINLGYTKAFEKRISLSTGDYIALCDQDDNVMEEKYRVTILNLGIFGKQEIKLQNIPYLLLMPLE